MDAAVSGPEMGNASSIASEASKPSQGSSLRDIISKTVSDFDNGNQPKPSENQGEQPSLENVDDNAPEKKLDLSPVGNDDLDDGQQEAPQAILEAPKHWDAEMRNAFQALDNPSAQKAMIQMSKNLENGLRKKIEGHAAERKLAQSVSELFAAPELQQDLQSNGMGAPEAIRQLTDLHLFAKKDPIGYAKWFMQQAGIDPQQLLPEKETHPQQEEDDFYDPELKKIHTQYGTLTQQYQALEKEHKQVVNYLLSQANQEKARQSQTVGQIISEFRESADDTGQLKYPHFADVEDEMAALMATHPRLKGLPANADKLHTAYEMAVWANPDLRAQRLDSETQSRIAKAEKERSLRRSKTAATIKPTPGANAPAKKVKMGLRDILADTMRQFGE